ncbi:MAG: DUF58 domain-containing protein [Candidatus Obscuribacterales bacterium]|jgi:uncharacterized protein (DUF58 family)|nr:DUF58 domain-containing protein [Candidatus Obscuribacterales bacterium]MBX9940940.1 DUF58 domain-containing protein [Candidatus Obscuribacterales bacterium]
MKETTELEIAQILERVAFCAIPINWKSDNPLPGVGERKSNFNGPGYDFREIDLFQDGDDVRHINWAVTARASDENEMWKTVHQEEKEVKSYVLVKVGHSMDFGTTRTTKRMLAAEMTASILFALDKTRDKAGLIVYTRDTPIADVPVSSASNVLYPGLTEILEADPYNLPAFASEGDGLAKALSGLPVSRSLVFIVSDFLDMSKKDWDELHEMALYHDVICIYVQDRREIELPKPSGIFQTIGWFYNLSDYRGASQWIWNSRSTRAQFTANFRQHEAQVLASLSERMCESLTVVTDEGDAAIPRILNLFSSHM